MLRIGFMMLMWSIVLVLDSLFLIAYVWLMDVGSLPHGSLHICMKS
jgi:hypothetical protein